MDSRYKICENVSELDWTGPEQGQISDFCSE